MVNMYMQDQYVRWLNMYMHDMKRIYMISQQIAPGPFIFGLFCPDVGHLKLVVTDYFPSKVYE